METVSIKGQGSLLTPGGAASRFGDGMLHFGEQALESGGRTIPFEKVDYVLLRRELFGFWMRRQLALKVGQEQYWFELRGKLPKDLLGRIAAPQETETNWHWIINLAIWVPVGRVVVALLV